MSLPSKYSTSELHDRTNGHGLDQGQRSRRHRGRECVGDIIGSDVPCIKESKEQADHEDVRELGEGGRHRIEISLGGPDDVMKIKLNKVVHSQMELSTRYDDGRESRIDATLQASLI